MSKTSVLVLFLTSYATVLTTQSLVDQGIHHAGSFRIIGGKVAPIAAYPFMASLRQYPNEHFCGGTIITNVWVLTAAHCVDGLSPVNMFVVVGTNKLNSGGISVKVRTTIIHSFYNKPVYLSNDIAMLQLDFPLTYSATIAPVTLDHVDPYSTVEVIMIGWGTTWYQGLRSNNLRELPTKTLPQTRCYSYWSSQITGDQMCTKLRIERGFCDFDAGGPLLRLDNKTQVALTTQSLINQEIDRAASFRILGGTVAENGAYPFMASLRELPNAHFCGGSIINSLWVLTAAHCVDGRAISRIKVVVGTNMLDSGGVATRIQRVVMHPDYRDRGIRPNDIALIRLASALTYSNTIAAVTIDMEDPGSTTNVTIIGWGITSRSGSLSNRLRKLSTTSITPVACRRYWSSITANQICTKLERGKGPEEGDSGSPLIGSSTKMLIGVAAGINAHGTYPDVYTRVSAITYMELEKLAGRLLNHALEKSKTTKFNIQNDRVYARRTTTGHPCTVCNITIINVSDTPLITRNFDSARMQGHHAKSVLKNAVRVETNFYGRQALPTQSLIDHGTDRALSFRILGGTIAEIGAYPFMASLRTLSNIHLCGGSIINYLWVATAAHCMLGRNASSIKVVVGTNLLDSGGTTVRAQRIVMHPDFVDTTLKPNDIAMIRLASALTYSSTVAAVTIADDPQFATDVILIGWGITKQRGLLSNSLRQYSTQPIPQAKCERYWDGVTANQICTKLKKGKGSCYGDSGGPLIHSGTKMQVGLMSFSASRACGVAPDVYTKVAAYADWIESTVKSVMS
ncbi:hypothetical protein Trydic_g12383 [Trypoxylus dichotomus]